MHPTQLSADELLAFCSVKRTRASGPGGQHRNKVETAIVITHIESGVVGQASEERSQHRNKDVAIKRLRINLAIEIREEREEAELPTELWQSRTKGKKIVVSQEHFDFAALLAEALDAAAFFNFDIKQAAEKLGVSTSQLIKFLKTNNQAFEYVNRERQKMDLHRLS